MRSLAIILVLALVGCTSGPSTPAVTTAADSLAMELIDASGGWDAWSDLPLLRFDWAFERDSVEMFKARHLWDRREDRARVEWSVGEDSTAVVILDLDASAAGEASGAAYVNGEVSPPADSLLAAGYSRFINDTYWLLAPLKVMDPGVNRSLAPDSARGDNRVLALSFGDVGLTPGDRYWLSVGPDGAIRGWTYVLEGDTNVTTWDWGSPQPLASPSGTLTFMTRKSKADGAAIVTTAFEDAPADAWASPLPILQ